MTNDLASLLASDLNLPRRSVSNTVKLLDDGATIPFISRYRKERTGGLDEVAVHRIKVRLDEMRALDKRKATILATIEEAGELTADLRSRIEETYDPVVLEDLYMPYKPKRRTRARMAIEKGLEPLAAIFMAQKTATPERSARRFLNDEVTSSEEALAGASDIVAEWMSESRKARSLVRARYMRNGIMTAKVVPGKEEEGAKYENYFNFSAPIRTVSSHRLLAMKRGEAEGVLKLSVTIDDNEMIERLTRLFVKPEATPGCEALIGNIVKDAYRRLIRPSIETEVWNTLKERADADAVKLFGENLRELLLASPLGHKRVMAIDPGFRTGCKVVCLDEKGDLLHHDVIFPHPPQNDLHGAAFKLSRLAEDFRVEAIGVGSGTAGRETEAFLKNVNFIRPLPVVTVNEQGASVYSASRLAREEFPDQDVTVRGAVSIGRRLIDPLAELVKIDPKSIGVGQYQHDVDQGLLKEQLEFVVESCVNSVGVDVNTASRELLSYVSGIGPALAANIVERRREKGKFRNRRELMDVSRMGEKSFQQCAGFLRIPEGENLLDNTGVHPERYELVENIARANGRTVETLVKNPRLLENLHYADFITRDVGEPTIKDILSELAKPGRDPRQKLEVQTFDDKVRTIADLYPGMILTGVVNNVTAFGCFVDLGLHENGLIHISQLADRFVSSPLEVVQVNQRLNVKVMEVDPRRGRIALTLKGVVQDV